MKNKIIYIAMVIAIILGIIIVVTKGFNVSLSNSDHTRIEIILGQEFNIEDVNKIVKDSIKEDAIVRKSTVFGTSITIDTKKITDEEITTLINKINEKYNKEFEFKDAKLGQVISEMKLDNISSLSDDEINNKIKEIKDKYNLEYTKEELTDPLLDISIYNVQRIRLLDIIKQFAIPVIIALALTLAFVGIRFRKIEKKAFIKVPLEMLIKLVILEMFLVAVIAIIRIPINSYVLAILLLIGVVYMIAMNLKYEKKIIKE